LGIFSYQPHTKPSDLISKEGEYPNSVNFLGIGSPADIINSVLNPVSNRFVNSLPHSIPPN